MYQKKNLIKFYK